MHVPEAGTEARLDGVPDRRSYETTASDESIQTALPEDGFLRLKWRPKVLEARVDPTLTVSATYGVAFGMRVHTEESNRPATFIIDKEGVLRYAKRGTSFSDRPTPKQILSELKKLQSK